MDDYRLLQEMQRRGLLTMRVNALLRPGGDPAAVLAAIDASGLRDGDGDAWLRVGGVKLAVDGGFEGGLMREPYSEPWGEGGSFRGLQIMTRPAFEQVVSGSTIAAGAWRPTPSATRPSISSSTPTSRRTPARQSPVAAGRSSTPSSAVPITCRGSRRWAWRSPSRTISIWPGRAWWRIGGRRGRPSPRRCARYLDAGLPVSSGTDAPVVPYPPLWTLYHFVTRDTLSGGVLGLDQRVTRAEALRMATIANAWLTMEERDKGSLEAGKLADLVVLSDDPLTCPEPRLRDAQVLMTIVGGRVVHDQLK